MEAARVIVNIMLGLLVICAGPVRAQEYPGA
jgi:hypothetical protein